MNHYYDVRLKEARLNELEQFDNFSFVKGNLADKAVIESIFEQYKPEIVVNLGAQAGVRYSITNPDAYVEANLIGFYNILETCRHSYDEGHTPVEHLVYSSCVKECFFRRSRTFSPNFMFATFLWRSYRAVTMCNGICKYSIWKMQQIFTFTS